MAEEENKKDKKQTAEDREEKVERIRRLMAERMSDQPARSATFVSTTTKVRARSISAFMLSCKPDHQTELTGRN